MRYRFVHAADLHLDSPLTGLGQHSDALRERLVDATLDAFDAVVKRTIESDAAFLVLAGDLYDGIERGARAQIRFQRGLKRLAERQIQVFITHGNHDPQGGRWLAIRSWPEGVHVFESGAPQTIKVEREGRLLARVHGVSYGSRHETDNLALRFPTGSKGALDIAVLHCNVGEDQEHGAYSPCTLEDLQSRKMDYWALGHLHRHRVLATTPAHIVYPGTTQGRGFHPWDMGPKGAVEVEVVNGRVANVSFFPTDSVRFLDVEVDISTSSDLGELHDALTRISRDLSVEHSTCPLLLRARLKGRGVMHQHVRQFDKRRELQAELDLATAPLEHYWMEIVDETSAPFDLEDLARGEDLRAALIATVNGWKEGDSNLPADLVRDLRAIVPDLHSSALSTLLDRALFEVLERIEQGNQR